MEIVVEKDNDDDDHGDGYYTEDNTVLAPSMSYLALTQRRTKQSPSGVATEESNNHQPKQNAPRGRLVRVLFQASTIGLLYLFFVMGIFSSLRTSKNAASATTVSATLQQSSFAAQRGNNFPMETRDLENRLKGALWGFFAGDALASPTHWFYGGQRQIVSEYGHPIRDYTQPNKHLGGSILNKSDPNGGGRMKSISKKSKISIIGDIINHGKLPYWAPNQSYHYHATLQKGENTLEASIARVLMKSIVATNGSFDPEHFRNAYMEFMQTKGSHNDTYASTCHRMFFANLIFNELSPKDCPDNDSHNVDAMDGLVLPTIVALSMDSEVVKKSEACAGVTRKSKILEQIAGQWSEVVVGALGSSTAAFSESLANFAKQTIRRSPDPRVNEARTMSACYLGSSLPGLIDMVAKHAPKSQTDGNAVWDALVANANVGGENVHRASAMGAVLGARAGYDALPTKLMDGLYAKDDLEHEIEAFVKAVLPKSQDIQ